MCACFRNVRASARAWFIFKTIESKNYYLSSFCWCIKHTIVTLIHTHVEAPTDQRLPDITFRILSCCQFFIWLLKYYCYTAAILLLCCHVWWLLSYASNRSHISKMSHLTNWTVFIFITTKQYRTRALTHIYKHFTLTIFRINAAEHRRKKHTTSRHIHHILWCVFND